jgi:flagellar biogenesis protein FliO
MRHNHNKSIAKPETLEGLKIRILIPFAYTLAAVLLVFSANTLESKPESSKTARNKTQTEKAEKAAEPRKSSDAEKVEKTGEPQKTSEAEADKRTENPESQEINNSWMNTIHGGKAAPAADSSEENRATSSTSTLNPTPDSADSTETEAADRALFTPENQVEPPSFLSVIIRFILLMAALVGGLWFVARFIKQKQGIPLSGENTLLKVIVSLPLMPGKYLQVVELAGQIMVLGISEQGVSLVRSIEDGPTADRIRIWKDSHSSDSYDPVSLMDRFSSVLSAKDFQFWKHETKSPVRSKAANTSFADLLTGDLSESNRTTYDKESHKASDLNQLLSNQKRRLAALKKKGTLPEEEEDQ